MENNLIGQNAKALCISGVVRSIFSEMEYDNNHVQNNELYTKGFKEGYDEALRNLRVIIKQEFEIDVRK
jgi:hypothetical protein